MESKLRRIWRWSWRLLGSGSLLIFGGGILVVLIAAADIYFNRDKDETRSADAAVVLGAAAWGNRPSNVFRMRLDRAIELYDDGYVDYLVFTGGQGQPDEPAEAEVARSYAIRQGVPAEAILVETTSTTTWENLANAQAVAAAAGIESYLIVTSDFHIRRATRMAADLGMEAYAAPAQTIWLYERTRNWQYFREVLAYSYFLVTRIF